MHAHHPTPEKPPSYTTRPQPQPQAQAPQESVSQSEMATRIRGIRPHQRLAVLDPGRAQVPRQRGVAQPAALELEHAQMARKLLAAKPRPEAAAAAIVVVVVVVVVVV
jgi:hypothetical protein